MKFYTIGVYNSTEQVYFNKLIENGIDTFCDIRQRRGVRGAKYSFVNSKRLQSKLHDLNIQYGHILDLAPTTEIRNLQKEADTKQGELKRDRNELGKVFKIAYKNKILSNYDFDYFIEKLEEINANRVVLFCVEEKPQACHRSLVTDKLEDLGYNVTHL